MKLEKLIEAMKATGYKFLGEGNDWGTGFEAIFQNEENWEESIKITIERTSFEELAEEGFYPNEMDWLGMTEEEKNPSDPEEEDEVPEELHLCNKCDEMYYEEMSTGECCDGATFRVVDKGDMGFR